MLENIASAYLIPGRLQGGVCGGRKVVAFAITLTKESNHMDGAVVLAASIGEHGVLLPHVTSPPPVYFPSCLAVRLSVCVPLC